MTHFLYILNIAQISIRKNDTYASLIFALHYQELINTSVGFKKIYLDYKQNLQVDNQN